MGAIKYEKITVAFKLEINYNMFVVKNNLFNKESKNENISN